MDGRSRLWAFMRRRQPPVFSPLTLRSLTSGALASAHIIDDGRRQVEEFLRQRYEAAEVVLCGSGTEALMLALRLSQAVVGRDAPVALPAYTCFDVASAAVGADARIALYDIEPATLAPDVESLGRCLSGGARVAVLSPLFGVPQPLDVLMPLLADHEALVIEDAAQGQGAAWRGRPLGSFGPMSVLSFGRGKGWSGGRGGALLIRDERLVAESERLGGALRNGQAGGEAKALLTAGAQWAMGRPTLYGLPASIPWLGLGETVYRDAPQPGRLPRSAARILRDTLEHADREAEARRRNADLFLLGIEERPEVQRVRVSEGTTPGFLRLPIRVSRGIRGFSDTERARCLGVAASYPSALGALDPVRERLAENLQVTPGADELAQRLVTLPTHSRLRDRERADLLRLVNTYRG